MTLEKNINETHLDHKYRLLVDMAKGDLDANWEQVSDELNLGMHKDTIRKGSIFLPEFHDYMVQKYESKEELPAYKETTEILAGGVQKSDKLIKLSESEKKNPEAVMLAHGYDPTEWELVSSKHNMWNTNDKKRGVQVLYASKISVKPKSTGFDVDKLIEKLTKKIKPYKRNTKVESGENLLELGFTDMHFGINSFDYYKETLDETVDLITSKNWDTIYLPIGSDLLHNDDFKGRTTNDTVIEKVDMEEAWEEAYRFYSIILQHCLENAVNVVAKYVCGNHDKTMAFGLVKALSKVYTEVDWDTTTKNKKLFTWKDVAILFLHGDKGAQRIGKTIYKEYGKLIADKKVVEIHSGDKHHTKTDDVSGVMFRILPTGAQTDEWHDEQSFTGSMKCFHLFEYKADKLKTIYHV